MKSYAPFHIITHYPTSEQGMQALSQRVADVHAEAVRTTINRLTCSNDQKLKILDSVIHAIRKAQGHRAHNS